MTPLLFLPLKADSLFPFPQEREKNNKILFILLILSKKNRVIRASLQVDQTQIRAKTNKTKRANSTPFLFFMKRLFFSIEISLHCSEKRIANRQSSIINIQCPFPLRRIVRNRNSDACIFITTTKKNQNPRNPCIFTSRPDANPCRELRKENL